MTLTVNVARRGFGVEKINRCLAKIREITDFVPRVGIVLGSGLGGFATQIRVEKTVSYADLPDFPVSTVAGHAGRFLLGYAGDVSSSSATSQTSPQSATT